MHKRELKRFLQKYGRLLEPITLLLLLGLFIVPILAVLNLSPITILKQGSGVLGVEDSKEVVVATIGGKHEIIKNEFVINRNDGWYRMSVQVDNHPEGNYSKPVLKIMNNTDTKKEISFKGSLSGSINSDIGVLFDKTNYVLLTKTDDFYTHSLELNSGEEKTIYLSVKSETNVLFDEVFELDIEVID